MTNDEDEGRELDDGELADVHGGSPIAYAIGFGIGYVFRLIANADPFDGNYYGVGA